MSATEKPPAAKTPDKTRFTNADSKVQGEGDYESARRFRDDTETFLKSADVPELARQAAPHSKQEAEALAEAEEIGRSHRADTKAGAAKSESPTEE